jgi:succinate dehydrogenase / fumarate reductase membrane anchor subunit
MKESRLWFLQFLTGAILLFLLTMHMGIMHLEDIFGFISRVSGAEPLDWKAVLHRSKQVAFLVVNIIFLGSALFHGLYGLRNILIEAIPAKKFGKILGLVITIFGIILFLYGSYATIGIYVKKF